MVEVELAVRRRRVKLILTDEQVQRSSLLVDQINRAREKTPHQDYRLKKLRVALEYGYFVGGMDILVHYLQTGKIRPGLTHSSVFMLATAVVFGCEELVRLLQVLPSQKPSRRRLAAASASTCPPLPNIPHFPLCDSMDCTV